ncbi:GNAT family N-acetyltransferase [Haloarcula nitratireducens]|uniref:GNAT family N-acetyltransferase n=1 Tax=Haloarcula nitratireducens TaxID=2487749 RepID=A0AAW4PCU0_9EURY|nr:GNAT family N-acetyltransferase [Halomicroarcula nitratireducens]MBX0295628.1 GNAT family N-acetyltransferase [Halomicroarcula nitratireducens]
MTREYPDDPAGEFPAPPRTVTDAEGREIELVPADDAERGRLVEMYLDFDPADRAQGIPPVKEEAIEKWLDTILEGDCVNVVARHDGHAVGHATLVPDRHDEHELAIFVLQSFQGAGIGTMLLETLLGQGQVEGIGRVWLTVERWNDPAIALYRKMGFETSNAESFEIEMAIQL